MATRIAMDGSAGGGRYGGCHAYLDEIGIGFAIVSLQLQYRVSYSSWIEISDCTTFGGNHNIFRVPAISFLLSFVPAISLGFPPYLWSSRHIFEVELCSRHIFGVPAVSFGFPPYLLSSRQKMLTSRRHPKSIVQNNHNIIHSIDDDDGNGTQDVEAGFIQTQE